MASQCTTLGRRHGGHAWVSGDVPGYVTPRPLRQDGVFVIMIVPLILVLFVFTGLALEFGQLYNRIVDLHGMAKAVALAAARELNGTPAGITAAQARAKETAESLKYQYFETGTAFTWRDAALSFSTAPSRSGTWVDASSAGSMAPTLYFARVDTASLDEEIGTVRTFFMKILSARLETVRLSDSAVAGRTAINVVPIGICAMGPRAAALPHTNGSTTLTELVQYGFRRGVSYDLMQLNPNGPTPARYAINPVAGPGENSNAFDTAILPHFACKGALWLPRVTGGEIHVSSLPSTSPLSSLSIPLNSRFDEYSGGPCAASGAPPDYNVKVYAYDQADSVKWMTPGTGSPSAASTTSGGRLQTIADLGSAPASAGDYGPLWAFSRAVQAPTPVDAPEPGSGYARFGMADWPTLYKSGPTASSANYGSGPYQSTIGSNYLAPQAANHEISTLRRRVLNIPLLSCSPSEPTGSNVPATVAGIGRFFMTVPATADRLIGEFAGVIAEEAIPAQVELFP